MKYCEKDLVRIAKRENNTKRSYLVVNPLQGKHVPVSPSMALALFSNLAEELRGKYSGEKLLLIGFAETATAIGAQVAVSLETKYIQTTREVIADVDYLFFSEEHSHATEQKLVKDDIDKEIDDTDRIIFVEDEVTTGNTILNIINVLKKQYSKSLKYAVASLLNGMTNEYLETYKNEDIDLYYLVKTDHSRYGEIADSYTGNGQYYEINDFAKSKISVIDIEGYMNARRVVESKNYELACSKLSNKVIEHLGANYVDSVLVVGTEEFMFPALYIGKRLEEKGYKVRCHSTTRSPITVSKESDYPLHTGYALRSLYDSNRETFIYDIDHYDQVIVITDAKFADEQGLQTLIAALKIKNSKIKIYRWC